jgi:alkanesulfonate monooxygenase SsuD/methylene tetrahydromethanopterin reductase-like flavin-dependent oxidoreductase (luciferase family)
MTAPFRFGVSTNSATSARELKEGARRLEGLGYHSLLFQDHYLGPGPAMSCGGCRAADSAGPGPR